MSYHAGKSNKERNTIQAMFMNGRLKIVAATVAFGMGLGEYLCNFS
jgi:superfamily II DNA helicase RecQ